MTRIIPIIAAAVLAGCATAAADDEPLDPVLPAPDEPHRVEPEGEPIPIADMDDEIPWPLELNALTACSLEEAHAVLRERVECTLGNEPFEDADESEIRRARAAIAFGEGGETKLVTYETGCVTAPKVVQVEVIAC